MPTFAIESPQTGQKYEVEFDREPSPEDLDFAAKHFDNEWWQQQGIEPGSAITQQTPLETVRNASFGGLGRVATQAVSGLAKLADVGGAQSFQSITGLPLSTGLQNLAKQADAITDESRRVYPMNPANPKASTLGEGAAQALGMLAPAGAARMLGAGAEIMTAVPATMGFAMGAGSGIDTGREMGLSPLGQMNMGLAFGAAESATEMLGGVGGRFLPPAQSLIGKALTGAASEAIEEPASGMLTEAITNVAAIPVADPKRPGFTTSGFQIPGPQGYLERRGMEALGGLAGGVIFAGAQLAAGGVGQPMSEAPAVAADAVPESTGDLTAADVQDLETLGQGDRETGKRQPILTGVPDRMGRMRESSLNEEPIMEGDVITDLRVPRSPEAIAESQRMENDRLAQEAKLRAQDAKARGMPMVADSPTGSRDIVDWANENPIFLPPGFSADRKNAEYDALQRNPLPPYWRQFVASSKQGGNPDSIAQRAFDAGLIAEPTPDAYLQALQEGIAGRQQYRVQFAQRDKALAQEEKRVIDFEKSQTKLAKKKDTQQVPFEDIVPGDEMTIDGEPAVVRNVEYNEDGYLTNVVIEDGKRFGLMQFDPQTRGGLLVDEFKPTSTTASTPATGPAQAPAASVGAVRGRASENEAAGGASPAMAPARGEVNLEDLNAELQMAGGLTNFRVDGTTAGFANAQILNEALDLVRQGFTTFANWSAQMIRRFGEGIRAVLADVWDNVRRNSQLGAVMNPLARGPLRAPESGMASASGAAQANEPSPGGLSEAEAEIKSMLPTDVRADYQKFDERSPILWRGETTFPDVRSVKIIGADASGKSRSIYPSAAITLSNGGVFVKRFRVSDHAQVSETAFRQYDLDYRLTREQNESEKAFDKRILQSAEADLISAARFAWEDQMQQLRPLVDSNYAASLEQQKSQQRQKRSAELQRDETMRFMRDDTMRPAKVYRNKFGWTYQDGILKDAQGQELGQFANLDAARFWIRDEYFKSSRAENGTQGFKNLDPSGRTAGFLNTEILAEARQLIADGFTTFANWSQAMLTRFGRGIREFLQGIWQQITSPQTNAAQNVRLGMPQGNAPVSIGAGGFVGGGQASNIPDGQNVSRSRFASPDEAANVISKRPDAEVLAEAQAWLAGRSDAEALASLENDRAALAGDARQRALGLLINKLGVQAMHGTEVQQIVNDALLNRAGRLWHSEQFSAELAREFRQRSVVGNADLLPIAPILATKQVLVDRADRVVKERFEGGAEGAVQQVKDIDTKASTQAGAELAAQLEGEPDAPELGDNPEVSPMNDNRVAELEKQMQDLREQMVREQTQAESTLAQTTSTWQKIMGVLQAAGGRKSSLLTGAKGKLAAMRKAALARKAARRAEGRLNANPVEDFADDAIIGAALLAEGVVEFTNWSQAILREVGFRSGQDLRKLYAEASKKYLEALEAEKAAPTKTKGTPKQRAAREKINRAQRTAQNILDSLARRYSDPPIFDEGQRRVNAMRELYKERVKTGMPEAEFVQRAKALGANEGTSSILWEASKLEIDAREMMALEKSRAGMAAYLQKDSPALAKMLDALRKKIAPGMTWAEIFMTLPAEQKARQREIYRRLMLDNRLKALNQGERLQLTNELDRAWQRERRKVFVRELEKITGLGKTKKDRDKVKAALPRLLRLMNLGMLNSETFRGALAQEYGIQQIDAATGAELRKLGEQIQQAPEGLPRRKLEQRLMERLQNLTGSTLFQVLDSWWTASVLSGWRTQVDIGFSLLNGIEDVGLGSLVTALRTGNKDVAVRGLGRLFARLPSAFLESVDHVATGNKALMRNFELEAKQALEGGNKLASDVGAEMWRRGGWRKVPGGFMIFYGRVLTALDHINTASTREGALAMALARHPELYEKALKISDADRQAAKNQARLELTGGDMPTTMQQRLEENARVRELLERGIPKEILGEATDIGRTAAMQGDPTGLGGGLLDAVNMAVGTVARKAESMSRRDNLDATSKQILKLLQGTAPVMRAITGTKFARTVAHSLNRTLSYVPVAGVYAVGQQGRTGAFGDVLAAKQVIGTLVGLALYLAFDDDDDEKGIEDGWKDKTPQEKAQLYAQGKQPYTVWSRNAKGQVVAYNYQQWGISGIVNTVGAMLKQKGSEQGTLNVLVSSLVQGAMTFTDKAQLQGLQTVFGENYRSTDPVSGIASNLNRWAAQTVGGMIPRVIKDIDVLFSPELRTSSEWWQKWTKEMPMLRQLSSGKRVDILGEDIKLDRGPLSRVMTIGTYDPAYRLLGRLNERDIYLPDPTQGVRIVVLNDGTRRKMTEVEKDRYQRATGAAYRKFLAESGEALLKLEPDAARTLISKVTERLRAQAAYEAVRR